MGLRAILAIAIFFVSLPVYAANGIQVIGVGAIHWGLGGAGTARPLDSTAVYLNPAGMNQVGKRVDLSFGVGFPNNRMDSSMAPGGNPQAVDVNSEDEAGLLPAASIIFSLWNKRLAIGLGTFFTNAFGVDYPISRIPTAITGNQYDTDSRYFLLKILPGFSYEIIEDKLFIGGAFHINYALLSTNSALQAPGFPQTSGRNETDPALGVGGSIGILYRPMKWFSFGTTYTTRQYFQKFDRYVDLLDEGFDMPQQVAAGVGFGPFSGALFLADFRWINWGHTGIIGRSITEGGLGWNDQYVIATGFQYNFYDQFKVPFVLRLGYNYGGSPVPSGAVFQNLLIPAITEHNLTTGFSVFLTKKIGIHAAYIHEFKNTATDDGSINPLAAGATYSVSGNSFNTQLNVNF